MSGQCNSIYEHTPCNKILIKCNLSRQFTKPTMWPVMWYLDPQNIWTTQSKYYWNMWTVFVILGPPPLPRHMRISRSEDVGYNRNIPAMDQTSTIFPWIIVPALELFLHQSSSSGSSWMEYTPPLNSPCTLRVHDYLGGRGSTVSHSITQVAPQRAAKRAEIVIYDRSAVQYSWIRSISGWIS